MLLNFFCLLWLILLRTILWWHCFCSLTNARFIEQFTKLTWYVHVPLLTFRTAFFCFSGNGFWRDNLIAQLKNFKLRGGLKLVGTSRKGTFYLTPKVVESLWIPYGLNRLYHIPNKAVLSKLLSFSSQPVHCYWSIIRLLIVEEIVVVWERLPLFITHSSRTW